MMLALKEAPISGVFFSTLDTKRMICVYLIIHKEGKDKKTTKRRPSND